MLGLSIRENGKGHGFWKLMCMYFLAVTSNPSCYTCTDFFSPISDSLYNAIHIWQLGPIFCCCRLLHSLPFWSSLPIFHWRVVLMAEVVSKVWSYAAICRVHLERGENEASGCSVSGDHTHHRYPSVRQFSCGSHQRVCVLCISINAQLVLYIAVCLWYHVP